MIKYKYCEDWEEMWKSDCRTTTFHTASCGEESRDLTVDQEPQSPDDD